MAATRAEGGCKGRDGKQKPSVKGNTSFTYSISTERLQLKSLDRSSDYMAILRQESKYSLKSWNDGSTISSGTSPATLYSQLNVWGQEIWAVKGGKEQKGCVEWSRVKFIWRLVEITSAHFQLTNWSAPGLCLRSPDSLNSFPKQSSHQIVFGTLLNKRLLKT